MDTLECTSDNQQEWVKYIRQAAIELGFSEARISPAYPSEESLARYRRWLEYNFHGSMTYLHTHEPLKANPGLLVPEAKVAIMVRMDYAHQSGVTLSHNHQHTLDQGTKALVANYAKGRDYHKVVRKKLQVLTERIEKRLGPLGCRVFTDSGPVMEVELAQQSGLGWRGKNTLLVSRTGSWFFLGEILLDQDLPVDEPIKDHCGSCQRCLDVCPTQAFVAPYVLDARRCISYLTIELKEAIPSELRPLIGTRVYGCDDCQTVCPWNKFAQTSLEPDFSVREPWKDLDLLSAWQWTPEAFDEYTQGSAMRRIGYEQWLRNVAVALGNAKYSEAHRDALAREHPYETPLIKEHRLWAYEQQSSRKESVTHV